LVAVVLGIRWTELVSWVRALRPAASACMAPDASLNRCGDSETCRGTRSSPSGTHEASPALALYACLR
jgi:hypothetical protein